MTIPVSPINPAHYRGAHGVQVIELIRLLPFSLGNAIKYVYRFEGKANPAEDLEKALWYVADFVKHPETCSAPWHAVEAKAAEVLEGCPPWEAEACRSVLHLYKVVKTGNERHLSHEAGLVESMLQEKLSLY